MPTPSPVPSPTIILHTEHATPWTDPVAIGTLALALVTVIGVLASLCIASKDRRTAREIASKDRAGAEEIAKGDRAAAHNLSLAERERARRRALHARRIDMLLELGRAIGRQHALSGMPQAAEAGQHIRLLLRALPLDLAVLVRLQQGLTPAEMKLKARLAQLDPAGDLAARNRQITLDEMLEDIGRDIEILTLVDGDD